MFMNNSGGRTLLARIVYYLCRLLLPRLLVVNAATAARGQQRLLAEIDYLDSLLLQQQQQQGAKAAAATGAAGSDAVEGTPELPRLPYYLLGSTMSIAGRFAWHLWLPRTRTFQRPTGMGLIVIGRTCLYKYRAPRAFPNLAQLGISLWVQACWQHAHVASS
jgi:hypothetical protein